LIGSIAFDVGKRTWAAAGAAKKTKCKMQIEN
jgi:hypothetical protein